MSGYFTDSGLTYVISGCTYCPFFVNREDNVFEKTCLLLKKNIKYIIEEVNFSVLKECPLPKKISCMVVRHSYSETGKVTEDK